MDWIWFVVTVFMKNLFSNGNDGGGGEKIFTWYRVFFLERGGQTKTIVSQYTWRGAAVIKTIERVNIIRRRGRDDLSVFKRHTHTHTLVHISLCRPWRITSLTRSYIYAHVIYKLVHGRRYNYIYMYSRFSLTHTQNLTAIFLMDSSRRYGLIIHTHTYNMMYLYKNSLTVI